MKDVETYKIKNGLGNNEKVFVKHFPGATVDDMKSYIIPAKKYENNLAIIHCGTNDLRENKNAEQIAKNIIELATDMKTNNNNIMVSGIIPRNDKWNQKAMEVNSFLKSFCLNCKFYFIDNTNIAKDTHLNSSGLHLNHKGTYILGSNLVDAICL